MELRLSWPGAWGAEAIYWLLLVARRGLGQGWEQGPGARQGPSPGPPSPADGWREQMMNQGGGCRTQHPAHESLTLLGKEGWGRKTVFT